MKKTLSQLRSEAGKKGAAARAMKPKAPKDPLTTVGIRSSTKLILDRMAAERGKSMTDTLHEIIHGASTGLKPT